MFTRTGELREEFRHLDDDSGTPAAEAPSSPAPRPEPPPKKPNSPIAAGATEPAPPRAGGYPDRGPAGGPGFMDLIGLLAEPASLYLREAGTAGRGTLAADSRVEQSLELARLHIDLLAVLQEKTAGNLGAQEKATLDDVVYRLQLGYVEMTK